MAEDASAADTGTLAPHYRSPRKTSPRAETPSTPPTRPAPKKSKTDIAIGEAAARLAADAPPLSEGQRRRLAELFAGAVSAVKH